MSLSSSIPPLSQFSNTSSESSSDFVLLSKNSCEEYSQRSCSGCDESSRIKVDRSSTLKPGSPESQDQLIARVQNLTKENEELRGVLLQNNTLLQEYFHDLAGMQKNQKQTNEALRKGYDRARDVVKQLRERSASLKTELKNSQEKVAFLEEQLKIQEHKSVDNGGPMENTFVVKGEDCSQLESLHNVIQRLESDRNMLQVNNSKLQEHISVLQTLREAEQDIDFDEKCETLKYVDSLVSLSSGMQLSLTDKLPPSVLGIEEMKDRLNKTITEKEILKVDFEKLQIEKDQALQQCLNLQDKHDKLLSRMAEVQEENKELGKTVDDVRGNRASEDAKKQAAIVNQADAAGKVAELSHQVELEREKFTKLRNELDLSIHEKEMYKQKAEESEIKNESFTQLKCELEILTQEKETYLKKIQELEIEKEMSGKLEKQLDVATKERETYIKKLQELEVEKEMSGKLEKQLDVATKERDKYIKKLQELEVEKEKSGKLEKQLDVATKEREKYIKKLQELEVEKEMSGKLEKQLDVATKEREKYIKKIQELEVEKEMSGKLEKQLDVATKEREKYLKKFQELEVEKEKSGKLEKQLDVATKERETYIKKIQQLELEMEKFGKLEKQLDDATQERETYMKKVEELELAKERKEKKDTEAMKHQFMEYENHGKEAVAATDQSTQLAEEMAEVKHQLCVEKETIRKMQEELNILALERNIYKTKTEEFEARLEEAKNSAEAFGLEEDPVMKEKLDQMTQIKKQLWHYQNREGDLLDRENNLLEKEEACKKILQDKEKIELQLQEVLKRQELLLKEAEEREEEAETRKKDKEKIELQLQEALKREELLLQEAEKHEEEAETLKTQLSSMSTQLNDTHEQKTSLLREELQKASSELGAVQSREEHLRAQVLQLIRENESLEVENERIIDEASQKDDMYQRHLQKVAEENEEQKRQREEVIGTLKTRLTSIDVELQKSHNLQEVYRRDREDILAQHDQLVVEYDDLLKSFQSTLNANKHREDNANEEYRTQLDRLQSELSRADDAIRKKKEDCKLVEDELNKTKEDVFELQQQAEKIPLLEAQLELYETDFRVEREAREKQHEEILRLREQLQHYQDAEEEVINNTQMAEMQRRHGSYSTGSAEQRIQNTGGLRGMLPGLFFIPGVNEPAGIPGNMEGTPPDMARSPAQQEEPQAPEGEEDWICPTCRNLFPNFDLLQVHAVECNEAAQGNASRLPTYQVARFECPKCLTFFPDFDTLNIHVAECLDAE